LISSYLNFQNHQDDGKHAFGIVPGVDPILADAKILDNPPKGQRAISLIDEILDLVVPNYIENTGISLTQCDMVVKLFGSN